MKQVMNEQAVLVQPESKKDAPSVSENVVASPKSKGKAKVKPVADFKPDYAGDAAKVQRLKELTAEVEREIDAVVQAHDIYGSVKVDWNVVINLRTAVKNGIHVYGMAVNREHSRDEAKTGASLLTDGAQMWLNVITYRVAEQFKIDVKHLPNDPDQNRKPQPEDVVLIDGHGRLDALYQYKPEDWPVVYGHFPAKDKLDNYNLCKVCELINVFNKPWATTDFLQARLVEQGADADNGWKRIQELKKRGYRYQAACQLTCLSTDRVSRHKILTGKDTEIFKYYKYAKKISDALIGKFGEGDDMVLKNKAFSMKVSSLWNELRDINGQDFATEKLLAFINELSDDIVTKIKEAQKTDDGVSKDENRKKILQGEFNKFADRENIKLK